MSRRDKAIRIAVIVLAMLTMLAIGIWMMVDERRAEAAPSLWFEQGNGELAVPSSFWEPTTQIQVGRNAYFNLNEILLGHACPGYSVPACLSQEEIHEAMLEYHALRCAFFSWVHTDGSACLTHDEAMLIMKAGEDAGIDYRVTIPILLFESTFGRGSHNFYGCLGAWSVGGSFANQTEKCFARWAQWGNNPALIFAMWHNGDGYQDAYSRNCMAVFRGCDGGDGR